MRPATRWNLARGSVDLPRGAVMGIVNVTPDSFSDGGRWTSDLSGSVQVDSVVAEVRSWVSLGVRVVDAFDRPLESAEHGARRTPVAGVGVVCDRLVAARRAAVP